MERVPRMRPAQNGLRHDRLDEVTSAGSNHRAKK